MKQINNYISEKLYIGKDYKAELTPDDFLQIFKDNDLYLRTSKDKRHDGMMLGMIMKYENQTYPYIGIHLFDNYFQPYGKDEFTIYTISGVDVKLKVDNKFHLKNNDKSMLTYDEYNAKLIIDFLKNAKD